MQNCHPCPDTSQLVISIPTCLLAAFSPNIEILFVARLLGGVAAGMAYPTTLSLITALWSGTRRVGAIALWSGIGGAISALGPLTAGWLLGHFFWGSVFLVTLPLAVVTLALVVALVPVHVNESRARVDNLGGVLSIVLVSTLVLAINFATTAGAGGMVLVLSILALASGTGFFLRQRKATPPLYDLHVASRRIFWVAAIGGVIVFGSLMGAMYVGQLFLQNVLGYSALQSGLSILPAAVLMILAAPVSGRLVVRRGSRFAFLVGYVFLLLGFLVMLLFWNVESTYWPIGIAYAFVGLGVGFAGPPASRSLTSSVPVARAGMASGTADLQRDLGGSIMQSILGAVLTIGYSTAIASDIADAPASVQSEITSGVQTQLQKSFAGAESIAKQYPEYAQQILDAARESFLQGSNWAYLAGIITMVIGSVLVFFLYPKHRAETKLLASYAAEKYPGHK